MLWSALGAPWKDGQGVKNAQLGACPGLDCAAGGRKQRVWVGSCYIGVLPREWVGLEGTARSGKRKVFLGEKHSGEFHSLLTICNYPYVMLDTLTANRLPAALSCQVLAAAE